MIPLSITTRNLPVILLFAVRMKASMSAQVRFVWAKAGAMTRQKTRARRAAERSSFVPIAMGMSWRDYREPADEHEAFREGVCEPHLGAYSCPQKIAVPK